MPSKLVKLKLIAAAHGFRFFATLGLLNLIWEAAQIPFYSIWQDGTWSEIVFAVAHCTAGDVLIGIFSATGAVFMAGIQWPRDPRTSLIFSGYFIGFGLSYTVFSEWLNVAFRKSWAYSPLMPVIPPLDTGLLPVLQWVVVPMLVLWLNRRNCVLLNS